MGDGQEVRILKHSSVQLSTTVASPKVSVVLPFYNAESFLDEAVGSILAQSFGDLELIAVDDASTDASAEVVEAFRDPRIVLLRQPENTGYPGAVNVGLAAVRGTYIARMDADDVCHPRRLEAQVDFLEQHEEYCFVGTRRYLLTPGGKAIYPPGEDLPVFVVTWEQLMRGERHFTDASVMARRVDVERVGGYRTYQRSGQDVDLWLRLFEATGRPAATLTEPLYGRRLIPMAITFARSTAARNQLPRRLAEDRRARGTDAVMRGEAIPPLSEAADVKKAAWLNIVALWTTAYRCCAVGDYRGMWSFLACALRIAEPSRRYGYLMIKYTAKMILHVARLRRARLATEPQ